MIAGSMRSRYARMLEAFQGDSRTKCICVAHPLKLAARCLF